MGQGGRGLGSAPRRGRPSLLRGHGDWWKARRVALQSRRGHRATAQPPLSLGTTGRGASEPPEARGPHCYAMHPGTGMRERERKQTQRGVQPDRQTPFILRGYLGGGGGSDSSEPRGSPHQHQHQHQPERRQLSAGEASGYPPGKPQDVSFANVPTLRKALPPSSYKL